MFNMQRRIVVIVDTYIIDRQNRMCFPVIEDRKPMLSIDRSITDIITKQTLTTSLCLLSHCFMCSTVVVDNVRYHNGLTLRTESVLHVNQSKLTVN